MQELWHGVVLSRPGAPAQSWHRDSGHLFNQMLPAHAVTIFVPLVEITPQMGRTSFIPQTHLDKQASDKKPHVTPAIPLGSWLAFDSRIVHRGEANFGKEDRPLLYFVYSKEWFRDVNNFPSDKPLFRT